MTYYCINNHINVHTYQKHREAYRNYKKGLKSKALTDKITRKKPKSKLFNNETQNWKNQNYDF